MILQTIAHRLLLERMSFQSKTLHQV